MYTSVLVHVFALKRKVCLQWLVGFFHKMELDCHVHLLFPASFTHSVLLELKICQVPALFLILLVFHCGQHLADLQAVRQSSSPYVICLRQPSAHEILSKEADCKTTKHHCMGCASFLFTLLVQDLLHQQELRAQACQLISIVHLHVWAAHLLSIPTPMVYCHVL